MGARCAAYNGFKNHVVTCLSGLAKVKIVFVSFDFRCLKAAWRPLPW